jgi:N6-adenosine-specific RNA methylase IME4/predicted XRE-type DNA-binding protein
VEALPVAEKELKLYPWDKLQDILPPLSVEEERALKTSIAEQGILQPILVLPSGKIVDGVHRWQIFKELKPDKEPPKEILSLDDETAFLLGITLNIARRQMTPEQIRELQNNLKKDREVQKKVALGLRRKGGKQEEVAAIIGVTQQTISNWEQGEDITITKFCNSYNPRDLRMKLTQKQKEEIIERVASGESQSQIAADYKISQPRVSQIARRNHKTKNSNPVLPEGKFNVIYADPPWKYNFSKVSDWSVEVHYETLNLESIKNYVDETGVKIQDKFADNAVLFLWAPAPKLKEALEVITAWGFEYVTNAVWVKDRLGMGYWWMQKHEHLLLGKKGDFPPPDTDKRTPSVIEAPWNGHSTKPDCVYGMIEKMCPIPDNYRNARRDYYLELFKRGHKRPFWTGWGKEYAEV